MNFSWGKYLVKDNGFIWLGTDRNFSSITQVEPGKRLHCRYSISISHRWPHLTLCRGLLDLQHSALSHSSNSTLAILLTGNQELATLFFPKFSNSLVHRKIYLMGGGGTNLGRKKQAACVSTQKVRGSGGTPPLPPGKCFKNEMLKDRFWGYVWVQKAFSLTCSFWKAEFLIG